MVALSPPRIGSPPDLVERLDDWVTSVVIQQARSMAATWIDARRTTASEVEVELRSPSDELIMTITDDTLSIDGLEVAPPARSGSIPCPRGWWGDVVVTIDP